MIYRNERLDVVDNSNVPGSANCLFLFLFLDCFCLDTNRKNTRLLNFHIEYQLGSKDNHIETFLGCKRYHRILSRPQTFIGNFLDANKYIYMICGIKMSCRRQNGHTLLLLSEGLAKHFFFFHRKFTFQF